MKLRPFRSWQQQAFDRFSSKDSLPLFMEMRLGKSLVAIRWMEEKRKGPVLLVSPLTPMVGWQEELAAEGVSFCHYKKRQPDCDWVLITPALLIRVAKDLNPADWSGVVCDESTWMKNPKAQATKIALRKLAKIKLRSALTGLPNPQSERELFTQMAFVLGGSWMGCDNFWNWQQRFFYRAGFDWLPRNREKIKTALHSDAFVLSRKEAGVDTIKVFKRLSKPLDPEVSAIYRRAEKLWEIPGLETKNKLEVLTWLRRMIGGSMPGKSLPSWKYDELKSLLTTGDLQDQQVVVWFAFNNELARTWRMLKAEGISTTWIAGESSLEERMERCKLFAKGKRRVMLAQIACGKYGLNLATADTAIYFSSTYSQEARKQSEDRIVMPNKGPLLYIDMITDGTIDEDILEAKNQRTISSKWMLDRVEKRAHNDHPEKTSKKVGSHEGRRLGESRTKKRVQDS
jgi:SNF2-related domain/Helicase conserved C-terminal domain